ncbi:PREDICTED: SLAM family member 5-like [Cyprinodon variegatus]|uniref:SLAM family member 5-like n=1 Tax=Cyprinodon variegatus TaxID=28743 RepID=UPI0007426B17|nr:PREDICTED: SLAM family member 5-like [Cyprinodon variegatus]
MAVVVLLLLISVLDTVKGSETRFVKKGSDLLLDVDKNAIKQGDDFSWKCNSTFVVKFNDGTQPSVKGKYEGRSYFFKQNYSVVIRNVQHEDSGNYKARASGEEERIIADYTVIVQDPVTPVKLTTHSLDARDCNFTATCKVVDSEVSGIYQCYNQTCRALSKPDVKDSLLTVYIQEGSVVCNHSNNVSWTNDTQPLVSPCKNEPAVLNTGTIAGISVAVAVAVGCLLFGLFRFWKRKGSANTVYEVPQENPQTNPYESPAEVTTSSSPTSTYALVQFSHRLEQPNDTGTCPNKQPETIYAQVNRVDKNKSKPVTSNR